MPGIFAADSALMRTLTRIADVMILNFLFIVTSLPLVTIGASLTALNATAMRIVAGTDHSVTRDYFTAFRRDFRQATAIALILLAVGGAFAAWYFVVTQLVSDAVLQFLLLGGWFVLLFIAATSVLFVFPYLATFDDSTRDVLRNARLIGLRHPLAALAVLAITVLVIVVSVFSPQVTGYGLFWLLIGFGGLAVVHAVVFTRVFARYTPAAGAA
ncbi:YesL family protein [Microbacterium sp. NPDC056234]|uniref:YesL family protein n=1 Tax=Microbacterium sp. NPDC056234 TaxID=3345757 RepID=UPI0035DB4B11